MELSLIKMIRENDKSGKLIALFELDKTEQLNVEVKNFCSLTVNESKFFVLGRALLRERRGLSTTELEGSRMMVGQQEDRPYSMKIRKTPGSNTVFEVVTLIFHL